MTPAVGPFKRVGRPFPHGNGGRPLRGYPGGRDERIVASRDGKGAGAPAPSRRTRWVGGPPALSSSGSPRSIAEALSAVFTGGIWTVDALVDRGALILRRRGRWLRPLARRVLAHFGEGRRPRSILIVDYLLKDAGFWRAWETHRPKLRFDRWPHAEMIAPVGPPSTWAIHPLATPADLEAFLEIDSRHLDWFADPAGLSAKTAIGPLRHYRYEWRTKRSGEPRLIEAPKAELKRIQRRLLAGILDRIPPHEAAHGFRAGRSILTFAEGHVGRRVVLKMDLRDFFASIAAARILSIFLTAGYPEPVARLLTGLSTCRAPHEVLRSAGRPADLRRLRDLYGKRHLPQGAPTSPSLANLSAFRLDARLSGLAHASGGHYTRYADDLVFSGDDTFARHVERFALHAASVALEEGFEVNHRKTRFMRTGARQQIAGVVINQHPNIRRGDFDRLKAILHNCARHGPGSQNREASEDFRAHLAGRIAHVSMLNPERGRRLKDVFEHITW